MKKEKLLFTLFLFLLFTLNSNAASQYKYGTPIQVNGIWYSIYDEGETFLGENLNYYYNYPSKTLSFQAKGSRTWALTYIYYYKFKVSPNAVPNNTTIEFNSNNTSENENFNWGSAISYETNKSSNNYNTFKDFNNIGITNSNARAIVFAKDGSGTRTIKNIKVQMAPHIRLKSGSNITLGDVEINSSKQINVNFKSFLSTGAIKATSNNTFFTINGKTTHNVTTGVAFSANNNTSYDFAVTYNPTSEGEHTGIITITDGTSTATVTITANCVKKANTINWGSINTQIPVGETVSLNGVRSTCGSNITFESNDSNIIKVKNGNLVALAPGTVNITASTNGNDTYKEATSTLSFEATQKTIQAIVWDQEFYMLKLGGEDITLNAVATNKETGSPNDRPIVYSVADESIVSVADSILSIKKKGQTTITATQVGDENYATISVTKIVMVREVSDGCDDYFAVDALDKVEKGNDDIIGINGGGWDWSPIEIEHELKTVGENLSFIVKCSDGGTEKFGDTGGARLVIKDQNDKEIYNGKGNSQEKTITIDRSVKKLKFTLTCNLTKSISNIIVTPAIYVESDKAALNFADTEIGQTITETVNIDWANQPDMMLATIVGDTEGVFTITENATFGGSCGDHDVTPISISFAPKKQGTYSANLIVSMVEGATEKLNIPITATAVYRETTFNNPGNWNDNSNWSAGIPTGIGKNATIAAAVTIPDGYTAVANNITIADGGSITIAPQGKLKINNISGANANNLYLQANNKGSAILIYKNTADNKIDASVELNSIASSDGLRNDKPGNFKDPKWQYIGIVTETLQYSTINPNGTSNWIYRWDETTNATSCWAEKMKTGSTLSAWIGYCLAQENETTYNYSGTLVNGDHEYALTYTTENASGDLGNNLITNSYTAPIDITTLDVTDFTNAEANIYIYNTGSYSQWKEDFQLDGFAPGQVIVIPVNSVTALGNEYPRTIASGQAFFVKATNNNASFAVNYEENIYNATLNSNQKRAPKSALIDDFNVLKIEVTSTTSNDRLYLIEHENCTPDFDNGYDATKIFDNPNGPQIYASTSFGEASINTNNSFDGQTIGFVADNENELYTITFNTEKLHTYDQLWLYDTETETYIDILNKESYQFYGSKTPNNNRFYVTSINPNAPEGPTTTIETTTWNDIFDENQPIYVYTITGQLIQTSLDKTLPTGIYIVKSEKKTIKLQITNN